MNKLKTYLFEILLLLFTISIPYTLGTSETVGGMIASFLIFIILRYICYLFFFYSPYLCPFTSCNYMVWLSYHYYD